MLSFVDTLRNVSILFDDKPVLHTRYTKDKSATKNSKRLPYFAWLLYNYYRLNGWAHHIMAPLTCWPRGYCTGGPHQPNKRRYAPVGK